jgi:DNA-directed RNA polymerase II subunit RPB7
MYYLATMIRAVAVPASFLKSASTRVEHVNRVLPSEVQGTFCPIHGYVYMVVHTLHVDASGIVDESDGSVSFKATFVAVVFRPFAGEIVDAVVGEVRPDGFTASFGPVEVEVGLEAHMPRCYLYHVDSLKAAATSPRADVRIGANVRLRIVSFALKPGVTGVTCVGSMKALRGRSLVECDYLGVGPAASQR